MSQGRLPPLDSSRSRQPTVRVALPNIGEDAVSPTAGAQPQRAAHTIVSLPEVIYYLRHHYNMRCILLTLS